MPPNQPPLNFPPPPKRVDFLGPLLKAAQLKFQQQEVLSVPRIGVTDNFFDLGGHSLMAMRIASRLKETFDVEVPLRSLFETPTIAQIATLTEQLIVQQIEELSEEEVSRQLQEE